MKRSIVTRVARALSLLGAPLLLGPAVGAARAEFTVGSVVPAFSLQTPDEMTTTFKLASGVAQLTRDGKSEMPKLLAIHLLQPDCLQCRAQLKALEEVYKRFMDKGLVVLGISHRDDQKALAALGKELHITFPLLMGTGSDIAKKFAAGDTFGLIDYKGIVRFAQVGYGAGDEKVWIENIDAMLSGKPPLTETIERERLKVGDPFPAVVLPSLHTSEPMELVGAGGKLVFRGHDGKEMRPKGVMFFFSRY